MDTIKGGYYLRKEGDELKAYNAHGEPIERRPELEGKKPKAETIKIVEPTGTEPATPPEDAGPLDGKSLRVVPRTNDEGESTGWFDVFRGDEKLNEGALRRDDAEAMVGE